MVVLCNLEVSSPIKKWTDSLSQIVENLDLFLFKQKNLTLFLFSKETAGPSTETGKQKEGDRRDDVMGSVNR